MKPTRRFATRTKVPVDTSRKEIERTLSRYGANGFHYGWERRAVAASKGQTTMESRAVIGFVVKERRIQIDVPMPEDEREQRRMWRALLLLIKAKLEAIESGIGTLESEFLANVVTQSGATVGQILIPRLSEAVETGRLLPGKAT